MKVIGTTFTYALAQDKDKHFAEKNVPGIFEQHRLFSRKNLKLCNLPTAFENLHALLLVIHWSNGTLSLLFSLPML